MHRLVLVVVMVTMVERRRLSSIALSVHNYDLRLALAFPIQK